ncbi:cytochrome c oxidase accessory protein CcoG [Azospirillum sp. RWY-5-1]|uniref:Cytochrome c oxidase accessory protein CcoG n=1 Tax=Azospirillum oleiclasticum TaxID=2735135 RepID=A0ABX2T3Z9_9PROT|nr:cytochrome c oxidase accessory protein CcoG [Azospirillum oleiclasticum]NYZ11890.1 cytochrome c oxidase accessory protein CcoG [Azospirillum oleiclasticum]NYZ19050.1 cytochrome c oxidase accessory protein CcoG [Azospirillum oleiclasticum]
MSVITPVPPSQDEHVSHVEETPPLRSLFVHRPKVYCSDVAGPWRRIKWAALAVLLAVYYVTPWLRWDRGPGIPDQAVLVDMVGRRAYFLWIEIWPQEVYYLTGLLILGALGIFFASTLFGRVWCGYACPQTVWTDLYMWVERKIEGARTERIRLDKAPLSLRKLRLKLTKHAVWLLIALLTGGAWIFYFNDAPTLLGQMLSGEVSSTVLAFIGLFTASTYFLAGWAREQVCIYLCPWRSYQSAMLDEDSFVVTYEAWRGETRAPARKSQSWAERKAQGFGDCIDCKQCVYVCPTGTDIRKGQQISCIGCGLCIDACNEVMRQTGHPGDLIRFDTQSNQIATQAGHSARVRILRPRTIIYSLIMLTVACIMAGSLWLRPSLDVSVLRDRAPLYVTLASGEVQNAYTVKILNKTHQAATYRLTIAGLPGAELSTAQLDGRGPFLTLSAEPDSVATYRVFARLPAAAAKSGSTEVTVTAENTATGEIGRHPSVFMAP